MRPLPQAAPVKEFARADDHLPVRTPLTPERKDDTHVRAHTDAQAPRGEETGLRTQNERAGHMPQFEHTPAIPSNRNTVTNTVTDSGRAQREDGDRKVAQAWSGPDAAYRCLCYFFWCYYCYITVTDAALVCLCYYCCYHYFCITVADAAPSCLCYYCCYHGCYITVTDAAHSVSADTSRDGWCRVSHLCMSERMCHEPHVCMRE